MSTEQNKASAHQFIEEVLNQGNMSRINDLLAPDFVEHEELPPGVPRDREGVTLLMTMLRSAFPDFKATIDDMIAEGDKVVVRMTWTGTQQGEFMGMPPSGKPMSIGVIDIFRIEKDKLVEHWGLSDTMSMMEQLG
jgi:steroid delta-isomerase-like uncharacterized protein